MDLYEIQIGPSNTVSGPIKVKIPRVQGLHLSSDFATSSFPSYFLGVFSRIFSIHLCSFSVGLIFNSISFHSLFLSVEPWQRGRLRFVKSPTSLDSPLPNLPLPLLKFPASSNAEVSPLAAVIYVSFNFFALHSKFKLYRKIPVIFNIYQVFKKLFTI